MAKSVKKNGWLNKLSWRKKAFLFFVPIHFFYVIYCRYLLPPLTLTQLESIASDRVPFRREYVPFKDISSHLAIAMIAAEDSHFLTHDGFEWLEMRKAVLIRRGGGSTISQQTAKNTFLWQNPDLLRKLLEIYSTVLIEKMWGKLRILEVYLNIIEFEEGVYGAEAVAQQFFHKSARDLTREEAAKIAACVPNPKGCLRYRSNSPALRRVQRHILKEMAYIEQLDSTQRLYDF